MTTDNAYKLFVALAMQRGYTTTQISMFSREVYSELNLLIDKTSDEVVEYMEGIL